MSSANEKKGRNGGTRTEIAHGFTLGGVGLAIVIVSCAEPTANSGTGAVRRVSGVTSARSIANGGTHADSLRVLGAGGAGLRAASSARVPGTRTFSTASLADPGVTLCGVESWTLPYGLTLLPGVGEADFLHTPYFSPVADADAAVPRQPACGPAMTALPPGDPLRHSSYPDGTEQMEPVEVHFDTAVTTVSVYGVGAFKCYTGHYGRLTAYDATGGVIATNEMQMREPEDCAADSITYGAYGTVSGPRPLIRRLVIEPMQPWTWEVFIDNEDFGTGYAGAQYLVVLSPVPTVTAPSITLKVTPDRNGLLAPTINAYQNNICHVPGVPSSRGFTLQVVSADPANPAPLAGRSVAVAVDVTPFSGGHQHEGTRPVGSFAAGSAQATTSATTDATGRAHVTFFPPEAAGDYTITATTADAPPVTSAVRVGYDLVNLPPYANYTLIGATAIHPDAHHATPTMAAALRVLSDSLHEHGGAVLGVNDESLPLGGVFDLNANWAPPSHCSHRRGTAADIRSNTFSSQALVILRRVWPRLSGGRDPYREADHIHLTTIR